MAKQNKRKAKQAEARAAATAAGPTTEETRRTFIGRLKWGAIGAAAVGGGGLLVANEYAATAAEHDLTRIGKGKPKVVQIHDPTCPRCTALQREARAAVEAIEGEEICLLIANVRTAKGRDFASSHGVGHVTLLLFDGDGRVVEILEGPRRRRELESRFRQLVA